MDALGGLPPAKLLPYWRRGGKSCYLNIRTGKRCRKVNERNDIVKDLEKNKRTIRKVLFPIG